MQNDPIVICSIARTAQGNLLGSLKDVTSCELGSHVIKAAVNRAQLKPEQIEAVIMGCVLPAGLGQAPARQASIHAGLPVSTAATTINKMCGSGMHAIMLAHDLITVGTHEIMVAGGMESMTNAPYLLEKARQGYRLGHGKLIDHMFYDGLEDAYDKGKLMGTFAETTAQKYHFSREMQDDFAITSLQRAKQATQKGFFKDEITPITIHTKKGDIIVDKDEGPQTAKIEAIPNLKPAFFKDGTVTAANSSSISDGGAAVIIMRESKAKELNITPLARIHAHATFSQEPSWFTTAPVVAIKKVLEKAKWPKEKVELYEINEAFAVVVMAAIKDLNLDIEKVNVYGGACALGHPIGASGARLIVTLISALKQQHKKYGVASLCIGGGEATAMALEIV